MKKKYNLPDNEYQYWKPINQNNTLIEFDHLVAKKHIFIHPDYDEEYTIFSTISHHVFTVQAQKFKSQGEYIEYTEKSSDIRVFCNIRYQLSLKLPEILSTLPDQYCYHGGYGRYCTCKLKDEDGNEIFYQVVFKVWKKYGKMRLHVESAYPLEGKPGKSKKVNFWVICYNLLNGKKLPKEPI